MFQVLNHWSGRGRKSSLQGEGEGEGGSHYFVSGCALLSSQLWGSSADICSLPKDSGYCMAYFPRWWYNKKNGTCQLFIYGGCQGNNNNFQSQSICQNAKAVWASTVRGKHWCGLACPKAAVSFSDLTGLHLIRRGDRTS